MQLARTTNAPLAFAAALVLAGFAPHESQAQTALPPITIHVVVAVASEEAGTVDAAALDISEQLPAKYHSIRMIEERTIEVLFGEQAHVALPNGTEVRLIPVAVHGGQLHLQLEMPSVLNTSMRMANNRAFYVGGVPYGQGTLVFKLVPDFSAYVETPVGERAASPETTKANSGR